MTNEQFKCKGKMPDRSIKKFKTNCKFEGEFDNEGQVQGTSF